MWACPVLTVVWACPVPPVCSLRAPCALQVRSLLLHPNSGCEGVLGALETLRLGALKLKYRSGGPCTDCRGRAAPASYHDPPLIFDLHADPAEADNLPPRDPRRAPAEAAAAAALAETRRSVADDATSVVDWREAPAARLAMCCDATDRLCRCPAGRRFRFADALVPRRGGAASALHMAHPTEADLLRLAALNRTEGLTSDWKPDRSLGGAMRYLPIGCW